MTNQGVKFHLPLTYETLNANPTHFWLSNHPL